MNGAERKFDSLKKKTGSFYAAGFVIALVPSQLPKTRTQDHEPSVVKSCSRI
jgi:hypothetical protein